MLNSKNDLIDFSFSLRHIWRKWIHSQLLLSPLYIFDSQICISTSLFSTRSPTWPDGFVVEMFTIPTPHYFPLRPYSSLNQAARPEDIQCLSLWRKNF